MANIIDSMKDLFSSVGTGTNAFHELSKQLKSTTTSVDSLLTKNKDLERQNVKILNQELAIIQQQKNLKEAKSKNITEYNKEIATLKEYEKVLKDLYDNSVKITTQKRLEEKALKEVQKQIERSSQPLKTLKDDFTKLIAPLKNFEASIGQMSGGIVSSVLTMDNLSKTALKYGTTISSLSKNQRMYGGSLGDLKGALENVRKQTILGEQTFLEMSDQMTKGLLTGVKPTTTAMSQMAIAMEKTVGPNIDLIKEKWQSLINIQKTYPQVAKLVMEAQKAIAEGDKKKASALSGAALGKAFTLGLGAEQLDDIAQMTTEMSKTERDMLKYNNSVGKAQQAQQNALLGASKSMTDVLNVMANGVEKIYQLLESSPAITGGAVVAGGLGGGLMSAGQSALGSAHDIVDLTRTLKSFKGGGIFGRIPSFGGIGGWAGGASGASTAASTAAKAWRLGPVGSFGAGGSMAAPGAIPPVLGAGGAATSAAGGVTATSAAGLTVGAIAAATVAVLAAGAVGYAVGTLIQKHLASKTVAGTKNERYDDFLSRKMSKIGQGDIIGGFTGGSVMADIASEEESDRSRNTGDKYRRALDRKQGQLGTAGAGGKELEDKLIAARKSFKGTGDVEKDAIALDKIFTKIAKESGVANVSLKQMVGDINNMPNAYLSSIKELMKIRTEYEAQIQVIDKIQGMTDNQIQVTSQYGYVNQKSLDMSNKMAQEGYDAAKKAVGESTVEISKMVGSIEGASPALVGMLNGFNGVNASSEDVLAVSEGINDEMSRLRKESEALEKIPKAVGADGKEIENPKIASNADKINKLEGARNELIKNREILMQKEQMIVDKGIKNARAHFDASMQINSIYEQRLDLERTLMEAAQFGMGASVEMMQKQVNLQYEIMKNAAQAKDDQAKQAASATNLTTEEVKRMDLAKGNNEAQKMATQLAGNDEKKKMALLGYYKEYNKLAMDQMNAQKKIYDLTKDIREGYLSAMNEMALGSGEFEKIIATQKKGTSELVDYVQKATGVNFLNTMALGGNTTGQESQASRSQVMGGYSASGLYMQGPETSKTQNKDIHGMEEATKKANDMMTQATGAQSTVGTGTTTNEAATSAALRERGVAGTIQGNDPRLQTSRTVGADGLPINPAIPAGTAGSGEKLPGDAYNLGGQLLNGAKIGSAQYDASWNSFESGMGLAPVSTTSGNNVAAQTPTVSGTIFVQLSPDLVADIKEIKGVCLKLNQVGRSARNSV